jgi:cytoskeleton protein RodZ
VGQFGDKFRKAREAKNISLDDVSNATKITSRMLQAIEQERFDQLPGGVFNKGFIRAYAKHLGLNDEDAVSDYLICLREAQVDAHEVWDPVPPRTDAPEKRPLPPYRKPTLKAQPAPRNDDDELPDLQLPRAEHVQPPRDKFLNDRRPGIPWSLVAVTVVIIVLAIILWTRHSRSPRTQAANTTPPNPATTASIATPAPAPASTAPTSKTQPASAPAQHPSALTPQPQQSPKPATPRAPVAAPANQPANATGKISATNSAASPTPLPSSPAAASLTLTIRATETSWISVIADGQAVSDETLIAPAHASFHASRQITVHVGNAAGVTFLWNGQDIPAQGAESEVKTLVFDATGIRQVATPAPNQ